MPTSFEFLCAGLAAAASVVLLLVLAARHDRERRARFGGRIRFDALGPVECERGECHFPNCPADCPELADAAKACAWRAGEGVHVGIIAQSTEGKHALSARLRASFEKKGGES